MNRKKNNSEAETSRIVQSHDIQLDNKYVTWIAELKDRYRSAQTKAAVKVYAEKLMFNWQLGLDLVQKKAEERWGSGVVEQVSLDLKKAFPNADGFSTSNLWYMKNGLFSIQNQRLLKNSNDPLENFLNNLHLSHGDSISK